LNQITFKNRKMLEPFQFSMFIRMNKLQRHIQKFFEWGMCKFFVCGGGFLVFFSKTLANWRIFGWKVGTNHHYGYELNYKYNYLDLKIHSCAFYICCSNLKEAENFKFTLIMMMMMSFYSTVKCRASTKLLNLTRLLAKAASSLSCLPRWTASLP